MYHGPLTSRRRDHTRAIPSRSTISFFFCFRSRYRQPGRVTRLRRLWQDGLLREARYARAPAPLETSLYDPRAQRRSRFDNGSPISNATSALENAISRSTTCLRARMATLFAARCPSLPLRGHFARFRIMKKMGRKEREIVNP